MKLVQPQSFGAKAVTKCSSSIFSVVLVLIVIAVGCTKPDSTPSTIVSNSNSDKPIRVVTTVGMVADLVREIGGESVSVRQLMGSGVDPHLYKATRDDVIALMDAEMVFYCGLMLEGKMGEVLNKGSDKQIRTAVTRAIPKDKLFSDEGSEHYDPHVWMDVSLWILAANEVEKELSAFRPANKAKYAERLAMLTKKLEALDAYGQKVMATVPESKRVLITSHDAFRYFGRRYRIEVQGVQGISTDSEAGLQRIGELVNTIVSRKIESVFVESSVPQDSIQALVQGASSQGFTVKIGGELFSDAMGEPGTYKGTYVGMLDHNLTLVAKSLGGTPPEKGFAGANP
jgi:manganese/zinc/iron transport system substrate-binding protein